MKKLLPMAITLVAISFASDTGFGKSQGNAAAALPVMTGGAHHATAPGAMPRFNGAPRFYSGSAINRGQYRPTIVISNGSRTFVYPSVRSTLTPRSIHPVLNRSNPSSPIHRGSSYATLTSQHTAKLTGTSSNPALRPNISGRSKLDPQTSTQLRNWHGTPDSFAQARQNHDEHWHHHHDHDWWRHHCLAIVFFDWGWWGWDDGWWYPAWGYDPYSYYEYNEPIYGDGGLAPGEIVANVQGALQQQGYYDYAVDGVMGPLTKAAIGRYQRDHRLPITYGIDPATLGALGLVAQ